MDLKGVHKFFEALSNELESMEIDHLAMRNFNELSAGQHQKVSLARGLVQESEIILLDEPTSNLDVRHQMYVSAFLRELVEKGEISRTVFDKVARGNAVRVLGL